MKYSAKEKVSDRFGEFIQSYLDPILKQSPILKHRAIIRKSSKLNELLFDNNNSLVLLFDQTRKAYGENKSFTRDCAKIVFMDLKNLSRDRFMVSEKIIFDCFVFSMMTVLDEYKNMNKYNYLVFVEF